LFLHLPTVGDRLGDADRTVAILPGIGTIVNLSQVTAVVCLSRAETGRGILVLILASLSSLLGIILASLPEKEFECRAIACTLVQFKFEQSSFWSIFGVGLSNKLLASLLSMVATGVPTLTLGVLILTMAVSITKSFVIFLRAVTIVFFLLFDSVNGLVALS